MEKRNDVYCINSTFEVRDIGEGEERKPCICGYALRYNSMSEDMGFREIIARGALDKTDLSDVVFTFNHDTSKVLSRNNIPEGIGSLKLTVDSEGLFFEAIPTDTSYGRDLLENVRSGVINKCSFMFYLDWKDPEAQTWDWDNGSRGYDLRTINKIKKISDVSLVTFPAYSQASVTSYKRAKDDAEKEKQEALEREKLLIELNI